MSSSYHLLNLPDLVLHHICSFIDCPFDLYNFGNSCSLLRNVTSSESLWWTLCFRWFSGVWVHMPKTSTYDKPRDFMLDMMRHFSKQSICTKFECAFSNCEKWQRIDSKKLRFLINILRLSYFRGKSDHPAVLYEQWLYDIGLYCRVDPHSDFSQPNLVFSKNTILELTSLGQASERDLRRRKQPYKDPKYYIKRVSSSENWIKDLFPSSLHGSICPLIIDPLKDTSLKESSSFEDISICMGIILESRIKSSYTASDIPLNILGEAILDFQTVFNICFASSFPFLENKFGELSIKSALLIMIEENYFDIRLLQDVLDSDCLYVKAKDVLCDLASILKKSESVENIVEKTRCSLRKSLIFEAEKILFDGCETNAVTRINLTDSDLIGGDNSHQEMSAAAFISHTGVLVTWHLIGRTRY